MTNAFDQPAGHPWNIDPTRIERNWTAINVELDAPRPGRIERLLRWLGIPTHITRVVVATPALRRAWYVATGFVTLIALLSGDAKSTRDQLFTLLLVAPLVPVMGVAMAYGVQADPAHEMAVATPMRGLRLVVTRAVVVLATSIALVGFATLLGGGVEWLSFAWLLPSLALTAATIAAMTFTTPRRAAWIAAISWILFALIGRAAAEDPLAVFTMVGQVAMLALLCAAVLVSFLRRDRFEFLEVGI